MECGLWDKEAFLAITLYETQLAVGTDKESRYIADDHITPRLFARDRGHPVVGLNTPRTILLHSHAD